MKITNPATEEIIATLATDSQESVEMKFDLLQRAQKEWKQVSLKDRVLVIQKFSDLLEKNIEQLAAILTSEVIYC